MSESIVSKFDVLLDAYFDARKNRKKVRAIPKGRPVKSGQSSNHPSRLRSVSQALTQNFKRCCCERRALAKLRNHLRKLIPPA